MTSKEQLVSSLQLLWGETTAPRKGPKPALTLDQIVAAAIALADADGLEAVSMRRLATELGMSTMGLYRYVPGKAELLSLMLDTVSAPDAVPTPDTDRTWRQVLQDDAWAGRRLYLSHPWLLQVNWSRPVLGPGSIAGLERTMAGLSDLPFTDREKMTLVSQLDGYVTGCVRQEILYLRANEETGVSEEEFWQVQVPFLERAMESGAYPTMATMAEDTFDAGWEEAFDLGLTFLLDGAEAEVARRT